MDIDARVEAWVALQAMALPPLALAALLRALGDPAAVLRAGAAERRRIAGTLAGDAAARAPDPARVATALQWLGEPGHDFVAWDDDDFPPQLLETADPPPLLYCLGRRELLRGTLFAIVGSRNATDQGVADAQAFAAALGAAGLTIVSGLAAGIDAAAHRGALESPGGTIAVTGTGLDRVYPARHRELAHAIAERGLLVSEFGPGTPPRRQNFPRRNRIVSGLARGVLVVEATLSSGSLITARLAAEQGREVFALPGSIHSPFSKGCHRLIREGAKLVETAPDVLAELQLPGPAPATAPPAAGAPPADPDACAILGRLGHGPVAADVLAAATGWAAGRVAAALALLELDGRVARLPGGRWQRRSGSAAGGP